MHWFSLNCNTVAGKLHDLVPQLIQQRFCCCLHIAAQAEGDSAGIKLGDILESREIFFPHRDTQTDADHVQGALCSNLGQFTRNYTQTVKRAADNKRRYAPGEGSIPPVLLSGVSKGVPPLAHDFACKV